MRRPEPPVHLVGRTRRGPVGDGGPGLLAADGAAQAHPPHQALHRAARHRGAFSSELPPDLAGAAGPGVGRMRTRRISAMGTRSCRTRGQALAGSARCGTRAWWVDGAIRGTLRIGSTPYASR